MIALGRPDPSLLGTSKSLAFMISRAFLWLMRRPSRCNGAVTLTIAISREFQAEGFNSFLKEPSVEKCAVGFS
jgi:hypothetical protein